MAQQVATEFGVFTVPGVYAQVSVQDTTIGTGVQGVVFLLGEAEQGPSFAEEVRLADNAFGPDALASIRAKYGSGRIVDAFKGCSSAANDNKIPGTFSLCVPVKTNRSVAASGALTALDSTAYNRLAARIAGRPGNLVSYNVTTNAAEALPSTGFFLLCPPQVNTDVSLRASGAAAVSTTLTAAVLPSAAASQLDALSNVACIGGTNRSVVTAVAGNVTLTVDSGFQVHLVISTAWANLPTVGDLLYLPTGSPFTTANEGSYVVTAASGTRIDAYKLLDATGAGTARTAPSTETVAIAATTDVAAFGPMEVHVQNTTVVAGLGKSLEVADSGSANFHSIAFQFTSAGTNPPAVAAPWVSKSGAGFLIVPTSEYRVDLEVARASDGVDEHVRSGGEVALAVGYTGTTATAVIASGVLTITVVGGSGTSPSAIVLADYPTVSDLAAYLSSLTGFVAAAGSAQTGQLSPVDLDAGSYGLATTFGVAAGRIKHDGAQFLADVNAGSVLVSLLGTAPTGLPATSASAFLAGGTRGSTSAQDVADALAALEKVQGNFLVPLFAQDATADVAAGLTDASSTYTLVGVHQGSRDHVLRMSQIGNQRNRQAFLATRGTFTSDKAAAGAMASPRVAMFFNDVKALAADGSVKQFQPWMAAVKAAGMQAGGAYRAIFGKGIAISGTLHPGAGYDPDLLSNVDDALKAGLCPVVAKEDGTLQFASDQTTYRGINPVYNSIRGMYSADQAAAGLRQTLAKYVGETSSDAPASVILTDAERGLNALFDLKWIGPSDDAPRGWKDLSVQRVGPAVRASVAVKDNVATYFIILNILVQEPTQTA